MAAAKRPKKASPKKPAGTKKRRAPGRRIPLARQERVEILERIAREGGDTARIQAIKQLEAMEEEGPDGSEALEDRIRKK